MGFTTPPAGDLLPSRGAAAGSRTSSRPHSATTSKRQPRPERGAARSPCPTSTLPAEKPTRRTAARSAPTAASVDEKTRRPRGRVVRVSLLLARTPRDHRRHGLVGRLVTLVSDVAQPPTGSTRRARHALHRRVPDGCARRAVSLLDAVLSTEPGPRVPVHIASSRGIRLRLRHSPGLLRP